MFSGGTSNLRAHIERKHLQGSDDDQFTLKLLSSRDQHNPNKLQAIQTYHPFHYQNADEASTSSSQTAASQSFDAISQSPNMSSGIPSYETTKRLLKCAVRDLWPLSLLRGEGLQRLLKYYEPEYVLPNDREMTRLVQSWYKEGVLKLQEILCVEQNPVGLDAHLWEHSSGRKYLTISAHLVDSSWKLRRFVLSTTTLEDCHSLEGFSGAITKSLLDFGIIENRVMGVVCNENNFVKGEGEDSFQAPVWTTLQCINKTLKRFIDEGFGVPEIAQTLAKARKFIAHLQQNHHLTEELEKYHHANAALPPKNVVIDDPHEFASTYNMIDTFLQQRQAICMLLAFTCLDSDTTPTDEDWSLLADLFTTLGPFKVAFDFFNSTEDVTVSSVYPILTGLVHKLDAADPDVCDAVKNFKCSLLTNLNQKWKLPAGVFEEFEADMMVIATALDPRFKNLKFLSAEKAQGIWRNIHELVQSHGISDMRQAASSPPMEKRQRQSLYGDLLEYDSDAEPIDTPVDKIQREINSYQSERRPDRDSDPLIWWKTHQNTFPMLATLAARYLCQQCISTPPELSNGTESNKLKSNADLETVDQMILLHSNRSVLELYM